MMAEMRQPSDFPRALAAAMFVIGTSYVAITVICVRHLGAETPDYILDVRGRIVVVRIAALPSAPDT
jgi:amino acid transporter